ncbi:unnamed protein product [Arabidopsis lyrata]|uniref:Uncharacterized protein n=1 Tax=Arabidopsis lyrata subsp. lyrata TaxID=81972 RepID=D7M0H2_ARALL|nr:hypothetical protein ARALYDRAFT_908668 [Arabidopsis lyrata subsp. lyrata]CAH8270348.1 unnamed protein product [Arabidopsis lyrata]
MSGRRLAQGMLLFVEWSSFVLSHMISFSVSSRDIQCQEETMNMGAFSYISPRLWTAMRS